MADGKPDGNRVARPGVPIVDVEIRTADAGVEDANLDVVDAHLRFGNVMEPEAAFVAAFNKCLHREYLSFCATARDSLTLFGA